MALPRLERVNTLWFLTLGVTALAAAILVYILLLESALGAFSIRDASPAAIGQTSRPSVALLQSDYTKTVHQRLNLSDTTTTWLDETLLSWRRFLVEKERQISFQDISDQDLENGFLDDYDVLILPSVRAMSDVQIQRIQEFMQQGGSVLATWTPGVYRPDASWRGWSFVEETFGVEFQEFVERGVGNYRVYTDTFPGITPEGIYLPEYLAENGTSEPINGTGSEFIFREAQRAEARAADFPPLRTYVWSDTLNTNPPTRDYARAEIVRAPIRNTEGELVNQQAVKVTYFTWIGGDPSSEIPFPRTNAGVRRFTLRGNTPLTANVPSGYRVKVQVYNPGVKVRVTEPQRTQAAGFWYDFATDDLVSSDAVENTTGMAYGTYGEGRFVYMGFQRNAMGIGPEDREDWQQLAQVFANVMNYLRRRPVIWVHDWPHPYTAAGMMTGVANGDPSGLETAVSTLESENFPGTFFVDPAASDGARPLLNRMYDLGDVGVLDTLRTRSDGSADAQGRRLRERRQMLEGLVNGRAIRGYKATDRGELSKDYTLGGLVDAEVYTYFMPDSIGRRTTPKIMGKPVEALTRIGVSSRSDRDILGGDATVSMDLASSLIQDGIRRAEYEGGLFNLVYSEDLLGQNSGVLRGVARSLKGGTFWNASGDEVAHWWRLHRGLEADVEQRGPSRIFVRVSNGNGDIAQNASISISLGQSVESVNIRPELINILKVFGEGEDIPNYELKENGTVLVMEIEELKPQQYRIFHIDLLGPNTDPFRVSDGQ
ncbi:MAG: hypothetical protein JJ896_05310 [Rhodothermales bacterium]|nr:hypothetical protein [Rhodothermales bacterium]MBO6779052.1 hypothetical protein [Rhodothermales bacterium]